MGRAANPTRGFGGLVRKLRLDAGMTQADLAKAANATAGYIAKIELGQASTPSAKIVARIAKALRAPASVLLEASGVVPPAIAKAYRETPEEMLWFASLPRSARRKLSDHTDDNADRQERERIRRLAKRLSRGES